MHLLIPLALAALSAPAGSDPVLFSDPFRLGDDAVLRLEGTPGDVYWILCDTEVGNWMIPGGGWIGLGFSPDFRVLKQGTMSLLGYEEVVVEVPDDPELLNVTFHLQAAARPADDPEWHTSKRLDRSGVALDPSEILDVHPAAGSDVPRDAVFELWVYGGLDGQNVSAEHLVLTDLDRTKVIPHRIRVMERHGRTILSVTPHAPLPYGTTVRLEVLDDLPDETGSWLNGPRIHEWKVTEGVHPNTLNSPEEMLLAAQRVDEGLRPWKQAWEHLDWEIRNEALDHVPDPHAGPTPPGWDDYVDVYNRWFATAKYAQDLAEGWRMTGDESHASIARDHLRAWLVYEPRAVGPWYWSIMTDVAGLSFLEAADMLWDWDGFSDADRREFRLWFDGLAQAGLDWQADDDNLKPENIRSWTNALIATVGFFNGREDLVDYVFDPAAGNSFWFGDMFERGMDSQGRMFDEYRGDDTEYWRVTYPLYHLHAWAVLSQVGLHHGLDLFHRRDSDGNTQQAGWEHYLRYLDGTIEIDGLTETIIRFFCTSKYYLAQSVYRSPSIDEVFGMNGGEPYSEAHLRKRAATLTHSITETGPDTDPPEPPSDLRIRSAGVNSLVIEWDPPPYVHEGDLAYRYSVLRNDVEIATTAVPWVVDEGLEPDRGYTYGVKAIDSAGNVGPGAGEFLKTRDLPD